MNVRTHKKTDGQQAADKNKTFGDEYHLNLRQPNLKVIGPLRYGNIFHIS